MSLDPRILVEQLRQNNRYEAMRRLDDIAIPEYKSSYLRDVKDSYGLRYTIIIDVYETPTGLSVSPFVEFGEGDMVSTIRCSAENESIGDIESQCDKFWRNFGKPYDQPILN
jgi:hypothetical protein